MKELKGLCGNARSLKSRTATFRNLAASGSRMYVFPKTQ